MEKKQTKINKTNKTFLEKNKKENKKENKKNFLNLNYFKIFYKFDYFKDKNLEKKSLFFWSLLSFLLLILTIFLTNNLKNYSIIDSSTLIFTSIILIIGISFLVHTLFFTFINCFDERQKKSYLTSFLIGTFITYPIIFLSNFLNYLGQYYFNIMFSYFILFLSIILIIYFLLMIFFVFKNYFKTTKFKILTSFILIMIIYIIFFIPFYLNYLLTIN